MSLNKLKNDIRRISESAQKDDDILRSVRNSQILVQKMSDAVIEAIKEIPKESSEPDFDEMIKPLMDAIASVSDAVENIKMPEQTKSAPVSYEAVIERNSKSEMTGVILSPVTMQ